MRIKVVSDLHLEFSDYNVKNDQNADVLILSGDIMVAQDLHDHPEPGNTPDQVAIAQGTGLGRRQQAAQRYRNFLSRCSFQFPHVIYVMGNHEFYHGKFYAGIDYLRTECEKFPNIYLLERDTKIIDDVVFVGGTLWTNMNNRDPLTMHAIKDMMNDFRVVRNDQREYAAMSPLDVAHRHDKTLGYIKQIVDSHRDKRCVVVGHHAPSRLSTHEQYQAQTLMNGGYSSSLEEFILDRPQIKLWTHGHTHHPFDYVIGETRIVCNPRGYETEGYSEDSGWNPDIILEI